MCNDILYSLNGYDCFMTIDGIVEVLALKLYLITVNLFGPCD